MPSAFKRLSTRKPLTHLADMKKHQCNDCGKGLNVKYFFACRECTVNTGYTDAGEKKHTDIKLPEGITYEKSPNKSRSQKPIV